MADEVTEEMWEAAFKAHTDFLQSPGVIPLYTRIYLAMRAADPERERMRSALVSIANAVRIGAESDLLAWQSLAEAMRHTARSALSPSPAGGE